MDSTSGSLPAGWFEEVRKAARANNDARTDKAARADKATRADKAPQKEKVSAAWLFLAPEPSDLVTLNCGGKTFRFNKAMLTKNSEYFRACLTNASFTEGQTSTIDFDDDIDPEHLGIYLHLVYSKATGFEVHLASLQNLSEPRDLRALVKVYQLADRFLNEDLRLDMANLILNTADKLAHKDAGGLLMTEEKRIWWLKNFKNGFEALDKHNPDQIRLRCDLAAAFARGFPSEHLRPIVYLIEDNQEFLRELFLAMAERVSLLQDEASKNLKSIQRGIGLFGRSLDNSDYTAYA
ncbi:hypothetical protein CkaCkLH20_11057 [Colletotrichum karsti]|uniref:BTB domain-containing protein n=1 Tax=Colletotrichum karsti TaxID=1095194 RepID=A0A9P6LGA7_9PEZI|nr:uncharacterized protein CkaCkLH20_11057 [Colletotrichum karsti]KAF9871410.1 hypothetical protein CkaCkLH20_11057 [Colletotrichum karsti]